MRKLSADREAVRPADINFSTSAPMVLLRPPIALLSVSSVERMASRRVFSVSAWAALSSSCPFPISAETGMVFSFRRDNGEGVPGWFKHKDPLFQRVGLDVFVENHPGKGPGVFSPFSRKASISVKMPCSRSVMCVSRWALVKVKLSFWNLDTRQGSSKYSTVSPKRRILERP